MQMKMKIKIKIKIKIKMRMNVKIKQNKERHQKQNICNDTVSNDRIFGRRKINVIGRVEEEGEKDVK